MNAFISSFDPLRFQHLLIRWVACDNIPFQKLESPYFRDLMAYANSAIADSGSVPTHSTIRDWIVRSFNRHKGVVTELLRRSLSRINVSFDAWSSRKFMSTREILHEYGFEDRVGYFVTDNAESNDTCLEDLGSELGFKKQHRRLRCCGHIINLVARSILFGTDADAFEEDCQADKEIQDEVKLWRSKGPIGRLHNIVNWVERSGQRIERLHKLQSIENTALGLEDKTTYDVVMDNATRWNSSEAMMERGYMLRNALAVESQWADHPDWLARGRVAVQELWEDYRSLPIEQDTIPEQPTVARKTTDLDDFMTSIRKLGAQPAPSVCSMRDEYAEWVASADPGDCLVDDPIQYWLLRRRQYPRLSRMAIDLFSIPAMSSEPERIFSLAGQMVTAQRGRLKADLIGAAQCLSSWEKSGVIQISK
ncbi:transposase-like protein [Purpureocillium lilacinum]|uniref:Transposase-like protein n=1 Tax=Purpureocillium lilacinum TaxID=33203 RepID=A0A179F5Y1_PURLI|nr:transposase-like protein [Purpureocillium lilacinum]